MRAYGSRVKGKAKRFSDLDLAVKSDAELDLAELFALRDAFSESDLPIRVDVLDLHDVPPEFMAAIQNDLIPVM